jgi:hypothetical protein
LQGLVALTTQHPLAAKVGTISPAVMVSQSVYFVTEFVCSRKVLKQIFINNIILQNGVIWDVTPCGSCKDRRFGGTYRLLTRATRRNISEDSILHSHRRENLKSLQNNFEFMKRTGEFTNSPDNPSQSDRDSSCFYLVSPDDDGYIFVTLQLGFSPVAVVQQNNRQVTHITHNTKTQQNTTINDTTTANT